MKRSPLRNKFLNTKAYNRQRNYIFSLLGKEKKESYGSLNTNILTKTRIFWKTVTPFLSDKTKIFSRITLIEDENIISEDK